MVKLASKKLDFQTAELAVKKQKLKVNSQHDTDKKHLVVEECMLQQKERMQDKDQLRQKQAEECQERLVCLQIELTLANNFTNPLPNQNMNFEAFSNLPPPAMTTLTDISLEITLVV